MSGDLKIGRHGVVALAFYSSLAVGAALGAYALMQSSRGNTLIGACSGFAAVVLASVGAAKNSLAAFRLREPGRGTLAWLANPRQWLPPLNFQSKGDENA